MQLLGLTAATTFAAPLFFSNSASAAASNLCTLTPELIVGPYYVDGERIRKDITEKKPGVPLLLRITVLDNALCAPVQKAAVDIWHCDALGYYSGYTAMSPDDNNFGPPNGQAGPPPPPNPDEMPAPPAPTDQQTFFRGVQFTDARGVAEFKTIYPGWYFGRATHIHLKVHMAGKADQRQYVGGHVCHIGQLAFPDEISDAVAAAPPYYGRKLRRTRIEEDSVFTVETAAQAMVKLTQAKRDIAAGFIGEVAIALDPNATPKPAGMRPGPGGGPRGA